ncbi:PREDICTED: uncharacterized protein LOC104720505 isoform X3 [Camelina sativa]|uniref:Uncharacterized protein LOC104720505 isoform X3 n=1 Tax=Camelina sativa TaxID=90675 RepID=A0ABM1QTA1_CAMSA|nr:PREDICTED: uncharacterized protein LOC104720505 isoform X3 [Camelina sativa]
MILQSPKVGFYRRSKTIKGKRMPSSCKEKDQVKEGQILCYIEQLGGQFQRRKKWSSEEDEELIAAVKRHGEGSWALIAKEEFEGERTPSQLSQVRRIFVAGSCSSSSFCQFKTDNSEYLSLADHCL